MKVLSLNTHSWIEDNPLVKLNKLAEQIIEEDYDFVSLQEINQPMDEETRFDSSFIFPTNQDSIVSLKEKNFALLLVERLRELGRSYFWSWSASHIGYDIYDEGLAFLSKVPFEVEAVRVSESDKYDSIFTRYVQNITFKIQEKKVQLINGHFSHWEYEGHIDLFNIEWRNVLKIIDRTSSDHLLIMGDLNNEASITGQGYDLVFETLPNLLDSYKVAKQTDGEFTVPGEIDGWKNSNEGKRIDYILVDKAINVESYRVMFDGRSSPIVSDHYGVDITFSI